MPQNKDFALRLEIIDECLRNRQKNWTLKNLIDGVNDKLKERYGKSVQKRTIQNDLKYLKEEKQAPIEKKKRGSAVIFYYSDPNYSIKNLPIKSEEITFLYDAINILRQVNDFKILQEVDEIISKLHNTVKLTLDVGPPIIQFEKHTTAMGAEYIDNLYTAIKVRMPIRIIYQSFKSKIAKQFVAHPYLLKEYRNRWFLIARKEDSTSISIFALDRIKKIMNSADVYRPNDLFDSATYFHNLIGVTMPEGESVQAIEMKVVAKQCPYVLTKPIHRTQEVVRKYKNGDILIRLFLICNYELKSVLLGFGNDIEVIKPQKLRKEMSEIFRKAGKRYSK